MTEKYPFEFGEWYPDLEPYAHTGLVVATNVIHDESGYEPCPSRATIGSAPATAMTVYSPIPVFDPAGTDYIVAVGAVQPTGPTSFVRTSNYGTSWSTTSQVTTTSVTDKGGFSAAQLESVVVFCTPGLGNETFLSSDAGGTFTTTALSGLSGEVCGGVNNFVVLGDINATDGEFAIQWSAIGDANDWPTPNTDDARSKQSGREYLNPKYGKVTAIFGDEFFGYVFQERAITKMTYVGGDVVFSFDTFEEVRGAIRGAAVEVEDRIYFSDGRGFYVLAGSSVQPIGYGKVDESYAHLVEITGSGFGKAAHVRAKNLVCWLVGSGGVNELLMYNYRTGRWSLSDENMDEIFDPTKEWGGTDYYLGSIIGLGGDKLAGWTGASRDAELETAEAPLKAFKRSLVQGVRGFINEATGTSITVEIGARNDQSTTVSYTTLSSINSQTKMYNGRVEGRYHRAKFTITGGFDSAIGGEVHFTPQGEK